MKYLKSDFYYDLPEELIAQTPAEPRDSSRLLVYNRATGEMEHRVFKDVTEYLKRGRRSRRQQYQSFYLQGCMLIPQTAVRLKFSC